MAEIKIMTMRVTHLMTRTNLNKPRDFNKSKLRKWRDSCRKKAIMNSQEMIKVANKRVRKTRTHQRMLMATEEGSVINSLTTWVKPRLPKTQTWVLTNWESMLKTWIQSFLKRWFKKNLQIFTPCSMNSETACKPSITESSLLWRQSKTKKTT